MIGRGLSPRMTGANAVLVKAVILAYLRKENVNKQGTGSHEDVVGKEKQRAKMLPAPPKKENRGLGHRIPCDDLYWGHDLYHDLHEPSFDTNHIKMEILFVLIPVHQATI